MGRKILFTLVLIMLALFVKNNPAAAAGLVKSAGAQIGDVGAGLGDFLAALAG